MDISIIIIDEELTIEKTIAIVNNKQFFRLIEVAKSLNMKCLSFIDLDDFIIFNKNQCYCIKTELDILCSYKYVDMGLIELLRSGVQEGLNDEHLYLAIISEKSSLTIHK